MLSAVHTLSCYVTHHRFSETPEQHHPTNRPVRSSSSQDPPSPLLTLDGEVAEVDLEEPVGADDDGGAGELEARGRLLRAELFHQLVGGHLVTPPEQAVRGAVTAVRRRVLEYRK